MMLHAAFVLVRFEAYEHGRHRRWQFRRVPSVVNGLHEDTIARIQLYFFVAEVQDGVATHNRVKIDSVRSVE